ncbi:DUF305 domain-containing protein [Actinoplanes sp. LDG1-06]|uniref:DUF305 domain-containing protein n=1 Tax=Paractinoplanes ovalisporus TaxID=2810368 RepID=A0ABS2AQX0_9ACTN|nr:DUF305 domain-containing protein [Actinoplanes ovalisporus]MBM2621574.1 DUF305 domain-containing protein [Actinoplanes ovalisporus]
MKYVPRLLMVAVLGLAGCSSSGTGTEGAPAPQASVQGAVAGFGGTDLAWIEINIAMDEELLPLLELTPKRTQDAATLAMALQVKAFTEAELSILRQLHTRAGLPAENPHKGMPMPGMVTPEDLAGAKQLVGEAFDTTVAKLIKAHLEQSQSLARSEDKSGVEPQTRSLALQILRTREVALSTIPSSAP